MTVNSWISVILAVLALVLFTISFSVQATTQKPAKSKNCTSAFTSLLGWGAVIVLILLMPVQPLLERYFYDPHLDFIATVINHSVVVLFIISGIVWVLTCWTKDREAYNKLDRNCLLIVSLMNVGSVVCGAWGFFYTTRIIEPLGWTLVTIVTVVMVYEAKTSFSLGSRQEAYRRKR